MLDRSCDKGDGMLLCMLLRMGSPGAEDSVCHGRGDTGVDWEADIFGRASKCCSTGEDMAERVSIKEDITSVDAGFTCTRFESRRLSLR